MVMVPCFAIKDYQFKDLKLILMITNIAFSKVDLNVPDVSNDLFLL